MKVTSEQIKEGIAKYIDMELANKAQGLKKWMISLAGIMVMQNADSMINKYRETLLTFGIIEEDGMIDIDKLADMARKVAIDKGPVTEHIPIIGDVTFSESDIEALRRYITS